MKCSLLNRLCLIWLEILTLGFVLTPVVQAETASTPPPETTQSDTAQSDMAQSDTAQSDTAQSDMAAASEDASFVLFEPPSDERVDNSRGGASRPTEVKCLHDETYGYPLTALIPQSGVGLTVASHPTLLVYVPATTATWAHLTLRDADYHGLYQSLVEIPETGGVFSLPLPVDSPELEVGKTYHWSLALLCQPTQTDMPITGGQIRRVELSMEAAAPQSLLSQAVTHGRSGVWHDMLANLALLRQTEPQNHRLNGNWAALLQAEDLGAIANTPLLY